MNKSGAYSNPISATLKGIKDLFNKQEPVGRLKDGERLDGKRALITGASSGLGFATAIEMARRGAHVLMACRSGIPGKGEYVKAKSGSSAVDMIHVDLSDLNSVKMLIDNLNEQQIKLDILVCNAAIVPAKSRITNQGLEEMFVVNYLSKYFFVRSLWEQGSFNIENGNTPRIIFVSSESHRNPSMIDWEKFGMYDPYGMGKTVELYGYYKLLMTTFVNEFQRRINHEQVHASVFALCPGPVNSNIAREAPAIFKPLLKLVFSIFFKSPTKASEPILYLAASNDLEGKPLDYLFLMSRVDMDSKATDPENGKMLWDLSEKLLSDKGISFKPV